MKHLSSAALLCSTGEAQSLIDGKQYQVFLPSGLSRHGTATYPGLGLSDSNTLAIHVQSKLHSPSLKLRRPHL
jgi:hypothetical protein